MTLPVGTEMTTKFLKTKKASINIEAFLDYKNQLFYK